MDVVVFEVGDMVVYQGDQAVVRDVLKRGISILRRSGPKKGIPKFVQPSDLKLTKKVVKEEVVVAPLKTEKLDFVVVQLSLFS